LVLLEITGNLETLEDWPHGNNKGTTRIPKMHASAYRQLKLKRTTQKPIQAAAQMRNASNDVRDAPRNRTQSKNAGPSTPGDPVRDMYDAMDLSEALDSSSSSKFVQFIIRGVDEIIYIFFTHYSMSMGELISANNGPYMDAAGITACSGLVLLS
jgi:hypothetical protein